MRFKGGKHLAVLHELGSPRVREAIERYLALVGGDSRPTQDQALQALAAALDDLIAGLRGLPAGECPNDPADAPEGAYETLYAEAASRFPMLGDYPSADPIDLEDQDILVGDAIDDISDIASDLSEALWWWDRCGDSAGAWWVRFNFQAHWGRHLFDLRRHVHAKLWLA